MAEIDNRAAKINYQQAQQNLVNLTSPAAIATAQQDIATAKATVYLDTNNLIYLISPDQYYWQQQVAKAQQTLNDAKTAGGSLPNRRSTKSDRRRPGKIKILSRQPGGQPPPLAEDLCPYSLYCRLHVPIISSRSRFKPPTDAEIAAAQAALVVAQSSVQEAQWYLDALNGKDVPATATGANLAALETAKLNVQSAKAALDATQIYAPVDGTIMSVSAQLGDNVSSSAIIVMGDLSKLYVQTYVDESDYAMFQVGNARRGRLRRPARPDLHGQGH